MLRALWVVLVLIAVFVTIQTSQIAGLLALAGLMMLATANRPDLGMLTPRGFGILLAVILLTAVCVSVAASPQAAILGLTLAAWFFFEWCLFAFRARFALPQLQITRTIHQANRSVNSGWAGHPFLVRIVVRNPTRWRCPSVVLHDAPDQMDSLHAGQRFAVSLGPGEATISEYTITPTSPGELAFPGTHAAFIDYHGLFRAEAFVASPTAVTVLPQLVTRRGRQRAEKRWNALQPPGQHRHRRPGNSSELLDLRDYTPGDPLKSIAWKPSARRDRLITREFESDVPVRCTIFLDASNSTRVKGADGTPLSGFVTTAAGIFTAAHDQRDHISLVVFDAEQAEHHRAARTSSQSLKLMERLAKTCSRQPDVPETRPEILVSKLYPLLQRRHPELFDSKANVRPWSLFWRPLLDTRWGWLILIPYLLTPLLAIQSNWLNFAARNARIFKPGSGSLLLDAICFLLAFAAISLFPSVLATAYWLIFGFSGFVPARRKAFGRRKQIAAVLASLDGDTPAAVERYLRDDDAFAKRLGRYLQEHRLRFPPRRIGDDGTDRFHEPQKIRILSDALARSMMRAKDNELFVIIADLNDCSDSLERLVKACRLAKTRHHRVIVLTHSPPEEAVKDTKDALSKTVRRALSKGMQHRRDALRTQLIKAGATVRDLSATDSVETVLDYLDRLRGVRLRA